MPANLPVVVMRVNLPVDMPLRLLLKAEILHPYLPPGHLLPRVKGKVGILIDAPIDIPETREMAIDTRVVDLRTETVIEETTEEMTEEMTEETIEEMIEEIDIGNEARLVIPLHRITNPTREGRAAVSDILEDEEIK
jgi:hypothetical protein